MGLALAVVAVSCGGGETGDTSTTTSAAAEPETSVTTTTVVTPGSGAATQPPDTESGSDLPAELIPAGAVFVGDSGSGINIFSSTASFDEIAAFYESALGEAPVNVDGEAGERVASFLSPPMGVLVQVEEGDEELLIYITRTG